MKTIAATLLLALTLSSCAFLPAKRAESNSPSRVVARLQQIGLLQGASPDELDQGSPNAVANLLKERGQLLIVDERDYTAEAPAHYRPLFDLLKGINEDVDFELADLEIRKREREWGTAEAILATIQHAGRAYTSALYYSENVRVSGHYFDVVNRALADSDSRYRLFEFTVFCEDKDCKTNFYYGERPVDPNRFGIISLTHDQAAAIDRERLLPVCCDEFDVLKTGEIERLLEGYRAAGLLDGMSEQEIQQAKAEILLDTQYGANGLISYFPSLLCGFDTETGNFENPYAEITLQLAGISRGKFQPTSIVDEYEYDKPSKFSFELNGHRYESTLRNNGDWLDLSFIVLVNGALAEQGIDGRFYALDDEGQFVTVLFLSRAQHEQVTGGQFLALIDIGDSKAVEGGQEFEQQVREELGSGGGNP